MDKRFDYVISTFKLAYGLSDDFDISYGINGKSKIQIKKASTNVFKLKKNIDFNNITWKNWKNEKIPLLFNNLDKNLFERINHKVIINYDIIASCFYFLSGWQEYIFKLQNKFDRYPYKESSQFKLGITYKPIVNYYFDILKTAIEESYNTQLYSIFERNCSFVTCITHDIDKCNSAWLEGSWYALKRGDILTPIRLIFGKIFKEDSWFNFDDIISLENQNNIHSSYYFLCEHKSHGVLKNADYKIHNKKFYKVIDKILKSSSEVGVHGSFGTAENCEKLRNEMRKLKTNVLGNRFHYLKFDYTKTPMLLEKVGLKYDTTLGFPEHIGFRNSYCFPFYLYDFENESATKVLEIPLTIMDATLNLKKYMGLSQDLVLSEVSKIIEEVRKFKGCMTINWHNHYFSEFKFTGWKKVFEDIVNLCKSEGACILTAKEICDSYWNQNENSNSGRNK